MWFADPPARETTSAAVSAIHFHMHLLGHTGHTIPYHTIPFHTQPIANVVVQLPPSLNDRPKNPGVIDQASTKIGERKDGEPREYDSPTSTCYPNTDAVLCEQAPEEGLKAS